MSRHARRMVLSLSLLLLGIVFGHAAEHEGWIKGVFHSDSCKNCPTSYPDCPKHDTSPDNHVCHVHDAALVLQSVAILTPTQVSEPVTPSAPIRIWLIHLTEIFVPPTDLPTESITVSPPWVSFAGCSPLLF